MKRPEQSLKVYQIDVLTMRAPVPSDFSVSSDHLVKAEEVINHIYIKGASGGASAGSQDQYSFGSPS